jgi:pimeloyl-ACP methyl ester carboxylesterase
VGHENLYSSYTNNGQSPTQLSQEEIMRRLSAAAHSGFDPVPLLAALEQPGLWLWGDQDKSIPVPESEANLKGLMDQGRSNFTYAILPNADHNLQQTSQGLFNEIPYSPGYHSAYYTIVAAWLAEHVK